jgi:hypothetical protein
MRDEGSLAVHCVALDRGTAPQGAQDICASCGRSLVGDFSGALTFWLRGVVWRGFLNPLIGSLPSPHDVEVLIHLLDLSKAGRVKRFVKRKRGFN